MTYTPGDWWFKKRWVYVQKFTCKLFDPNATGIIDGDGTDDHQPPVPYSVHNYYHRQSARIRSHKHGWVLYCAKHDYGHTTAHHSLFLLSPFTSKIIKLPHLLRDFHPYSNEGFICHFSSDPTDPNCIFFVLEFDLFKTSKGASIRTCRLDDQGWTSQIVDSSTYGFVDVQYASGVFYCLACDGNLAAYTVSNKDWSFLTKEFSFSVGNRRGVVIDYYLLASEGELLLACLDRLALSGASSAHFSLYTYDWSPGVKTWVRKTCLGNQALFIGLSSTSSFAVSAPPSDIANRIYFRDYENNSKFYSFTDGKFHMSQGSERKPTAIWIQPPPQFST